MAGCQQHAPPSTGQEAAKEDEMELSARNQIPGTIKEITLGAVMADVSVDIGSETVLTSVITRNSVERLGLKAGDRVIVVIKATEVMLGKPAE
jgi:molybdopterin-binding protein